MPKRNPSDLKRSVLIGVFIALVAITAAWVWLSTGSPATPRPAAQAAGAETPTSPLAELGFNGETTNLSRADPSAVDGLTVGIVGEAKVVFDGVTDTREIDFANAISAGDGYISVNSAKYPQLSKGGTITFPRKYGDAVCYSQEYGYDFAQDCGICPQEVCESIDYSNPDKITVKVKSFSTYAANGVNWLNAPDDDTALLTGDEDYDLCEGCADWSGPFMLYDAVLALSKNKTLDEKQIGLGVDGDLLTKTPQLLTESSLCNSIRFSAIAQGQEIYASASTDAGLFDGINEDVTCEYAVIYAPQSTPQEQSTAIIAVILEVGQEEVPQ